MTITIGYSPLYLKWRGSHASPQRARLAVQHLLARADDDPRVTVDIIEPNLNDQNRIRRELGLVHSKRYIKDIFSGRNGEWHGSDPEQGRTAALMFEGTRILAERIVESEFAPGVFFNPQGAKHHAAFDHSSGFCVFNDMAYVANWFTQLGKKVVYLDWDVHHGDGVEALTLNNPGVLTISIHEWGIFPGTGLRSQWKKNALNFPMEAGDGDEEFLETIDIALEAIRDFEPDVFLLACGADGLKNDPLARLEYTIPGIAKAAHRVGKLCAKAGIPVLIGGAGGYQPYGETPVAWAETVWAIHEEMEKGLVPAFDESDFEWLGGAASTSITSEAFDDDETEAGIKEAHIDAIMDQLKDFPPDQWEELLTREEYDLVEHIIMPTILDHRQQSERAPF